MRRTWRYRPDGTSYEITARRPAPRAAVFLGDKTLEKQKAAQGLVRAEETPYVVQDLRAERADLWRKQKGDRLKAVLHAYKQTTGDL